MKVTTNCNPMKLAKLNDTATFTWDGGFYACLTEPGSLSPMIDNRHVFDLENHRLVEMPLSRLIHLVDVEVHVK